MDVASNTRRASKSGTRPSRPYQSTSAQTSRRLKRLKQLVHDETTDSGIADDNPLSAMTDSGSDNEYDELPAISTETASQASSSMGAPSNTHRVSKPGPHPSRASQSAGAQTSSSRGSRGSKRLVDEMTDSGFGSSRNSWSSKKKHH